METEKNIMSEKISNNWVNDIKTKMSCDIAIKLTKTRTVEDRLDIVYILMNNGYDVKIGKNEIYLTKQHL